MPCAVAGRGYAGAACGLRGRGGRTRLADPSACQVVPCAGAGGTASNGPITVSSETNPDAQNISLSLEEGYYYVSLQPGWHMDKQTPAGAQSVDATLLSGSTQWVYVSRQSTSWAEFSFGIGGREIWLNGKLNIGIDVQEPGEGGAGGVVVEGGAAGS